jgi:hypothetical protein
MQPFFALPPLIGTEDSVQRAGFVVKKSKVVMPTSDPVKVIGFEIKGSDHTIGLTADSALGVRSVSCGIDRSPCISESVSGCLASLRPSGAAATKRS